MLSIFGLFGHEVLKSLGGPLSLTKSLRKTNGVARLTSGIEGLKSSLDHRKPPCVGLQL